MVALYPPSICRRVQSAGKSPVCLQRRSKHVLQVFAVAMERIDKLSEASGLQTRLLAYKMQELHCHPHIIVEMRTKFTGPHCIGDV